MFKYSKTLCVVSMSFDMQIFIQRCLFRSRSIKIALFSDLLPSCSRVLLSFVSSAPTH